MSLLLLASSVSIEPATTTQVTFLVSVTPPSGLTFLVQRTDGAVVDVLLVSVGSVVTTDHVSVIAARLATVTPADTNLFNFDAIGTGSAAAVLGETAIQTVITTAAIP